MKKLVIASAAFMSSAGVALAGGCGGIGEAACTVPEISALEGTAALAVVAAIVLLAWERRRRAM